jgi:small subunit ribosomal protein S9
MVKKAKKDYVYAVGRRRSASARVRLYRGKGENTVNVQAMDKYFPGSINKDIWSKPFKVTETTDSYYVSVKVVGGGKKGQLEAVTHGIARALAQEKKEEFRKPLKDAGLLTRDSRVRERRKVGTGGRARRQKQSPKR